jgi:hypothetical protein
LSNLDVTTVRDIGVVINRDPFALDKFKGNPEDFGNELAKLI